MKTLVKVLIKTGYIICYLALAAIGALIGWGIGQLVKLIIK